MAKKRALENFFSPVSQKKTRVIGEKPALTTAAESPSTEASYHENYPFPIPHLPLHISDQLLEGPAANGKEINNQPDLDLLYFQPYILKPIQKDLFEFLRRELFFYRVQYKIKRGPTETLINTPRYTTVFGVDETSRFLPNGNLIDAESAAPVPASTRYRTCAPRRIPHCLDQLRQTTEVFTGATYNFCLVNYYATGEDSISYHSDDERFLGPNPAIASFSLGAPRDFLMKHKPASTAAHKHSAAVGEAPFAIGGGGDGGVAAADKPLKFLLASGDMILMRGRTQANWLHSIPKRKGAGADRGRINITFRKAVERGGTENYYRYNVGEGRVWRWDGVEGEMRVWDGVKGGRAGEVI